MKKQIQIILAAVLVFLLAACGPAQTTQAPPASAPAPAQASAVPVPEATPEATPEAQPTGTPAAPAVSTTEPEPTPAPAPEETLPEDGSYTTKEDVALYLHLYGHLPDNFITKRQAQDLGWSGGSLEPYAPGMCIGGSRFGNYEGLLPEAEGRTYTECDIDTLGAEKRGAKRIVFSNDGLIYYTGDHYESFELLYGEVEDD